jgi:hypothetical protein
MCDWFISQLHGDEHLVGRKRIYGDIEENSFSGILFYEFYWDNIMSPEKPGTFLKMLDGI